MTKSFVVVAVDLIKEPGFDKEFRYRAYVNSELFTERTWIWDDQYYIEECLQIEAPAGEYRIHFTVHGAAPEILKVQNIRIVEGPGKIAKGRLKLE